MNNQKIIEWLNTNKEVASYTRHLVRSTPDLFDDIKSDTFLTLLENINKNKLDLVPIFQRNEKEVVYIYFSYAWRTYMSNSTSKTYEFQQEKVSIDVNYFHETDDNINIEYVSKEEMDSKKKFVYSIDKSLEIKPKDTRSDKYGKQIISLYLKGLSLREISKQTDINHSLIGMDIKKYARHLFKNYEEKNII